MWLCGFDVLDSASQVRHDRFKSQDPALQLHERQAEHDLDSALQPIDALVESVKTGAQALEPDRRELVALGDQTDVILEPLRDDIKVTLHLAEL